MRNINSNFPSLESLNRIAKVIEQSERDIRGSEKELDDFERDLIQLRKDALERQETVSSQIRHLDALIDTTSTQLQELKLQSSDIRAKFESSTNKENATVASRLIVSLLEKIDGTVAEVEATLVSVTKDETPESLSGKETSLARSLHHLQVLARLRSTISPFRCGHLLSCLEGHLRRLRPGMEEALTHMAAARLEGIQWPKTLKGSQVPDEAFQRLSHSLRQLCTFQSLFLHEDAKSHLKTNPKLLMIDLLIQPIKERFDFHFRNPKVVKTSRIDKPEWFFTFMLNMLNDHSLFIQEFVQMVLNQTKLDTYDAMTEFIRAICEILIEKLNETDLKIIWIEGECDEELFWKYLNEALSFKVELQNCFLYPDEDPHPLYIFISNDYFQKWTELEKKYSSDFMNEVSLRTNAWEYYYRDDGDLENLVKPTHSSMVLLILLKSMEGRCRQINELEIGRAHV